MTATTAQPEPASPPRPPRRQAAAWTARRLARTALFAVARGLGYAAGTTAGSIIIWWFTHR